MSKLIARYTPNVQTWLGSKTKPEPWLHVVIEGSKAGSTKSPDKRMQYEYRIYVWDTRQVVEHDKLIKNNLGAALPAYFVPPRDNGTKLSDGYQVPDYSRVAVEATELPAELENLLSNGTGDNLYNYLYTHGCDDVTSMLSAYKDSKTGQVRRNHLANWIRRKQRNNEQILK